MIHKREDLQFSSNSDILNFLQGNKLYGDDFNLDKIQD